MYVANWVSMQVDSLLTSVNLSVGGYLPRPKSALYQKVIELNIKMNSVSYHLQATYQV